MNERTGVVLAALLLGAATVPAIAHPVTAETSSLGATLTEFDVFPGEINSNPRALVAAGRNVFFSAQFAPDCEGSRELFSTVSGVPALVKDLNTSTSGNCRGANDEIAALGDQVVFEGRDHPFDRDGTGLEPYVSDGTEEGTILLADLARGTADSTPSELTTVLGGTHVVFSADSTFHGREAFITDGTPAGTRLVADLVPGTDDSQPRGFVATASGFMFVTGSDLWDERLWRSDGTAQGTELVADLTTGEGPTSLERDTFTALGDKIIFAASFPDSGEEPWVSDGTTAGTRMLGELAPGDDPSVPKQFTTVGDTVYFVASGSDAAGADTGGELWATDGTPAGTRLVRDIVPGPGDGAIMHLTALGDRLAFVVTTAELGRELWISDGTTEGTHVLADRVPGSGLSGPWILGAVDGGVLVRSYLLGQLWITDGQTVRVVYEGSLPVMAQASSVVTSDNEVWFIGDTAEAGIEPWRITLPEAGDRTAPTITMTSPVDGSSHLLNSSLTAGYACTDEAGGSGIATCAGPVADGTAVDTSSVGARTFEVTAIDNAGNRATATSGYRVVYGFSGFSAPIQEGTNLVKAGRKLAFRFSVFDANGAPVTGMTDVRATVRRFACASEEATDAIEEEVVGAPGLKNGRDGSYQYNFPTARSWAGTCRTLGLDLGDGAVHGVDFQFR